MIATELMKISELDREIREKSLKECKEPKLKASYTNEMGYDFMQDDKISSDLKEALVDYFDGNVLDGNWGE